MLVLWTSYILANSLKFFKLLKLLLLKDYIATTFNKSLLNLYNFSLIVTLI